jgi:methyl-accepting chemotaxis protein
MGRTEQLAAQDVLFSELKQTLMPVMRMEATLKRENEEADQAFDSLVQDNLTLTLLVSGAGMLLSILLALLITRGIRSSLKRSVQFARRVADGEVGVSIRTRKRDETGELAASLNSMSGNLSQIVKGIKDSVLQVSSNSGQLAGTARTIAEGAQHHSDTVEETGASLQELSSSAEQIAQGTENQMSLLASCDEHMQQLAAFMQHLQENFNEITEATRSDSENVRKGAEAVKKLLEVMNIIETSSKDIEHMVAVIQDIADQTGMLALNAAIEAARAGEQGKGFSVVADEIGKLAERSRHSTGDIVNSVDQSRKVTKDGVGLVGEAEQLMSSIQERSEQSAALIVELAEGLENRVRTLQETAASLDRLNQISRTISDATREQNENTRQVSQAVEQLSELSHADSRAAEDMQSSSSELARMAEELSGLVSRFRVAGEQEEAPMLESSLSAPPTVIEEADNPSDDMVSLQQESASDSEAAA